MEGSAPTASLSGDDKLVSAVRAGDDHAFTAIYDRHAGELVAYCRHMLGSQHDAEDALQQTFLKAFRALQRGQERIALRPWLYTIARNEAISIIRRRRESVLEPDAIEPSVAPVSREVEVREELRAMLDDLARLPDEQREALVLSVIESMPGEEIAKLLATDRDRVKALVFRARRSLSQSREAREVSCAEIREQLSVLSGGSLRRKVLREHLLACEGCQEFRQDLVAAVAAGERGVEEIPAPTEPPLTLAR